MVKVIMSRLSTSAVTPAARHRHLYYCVILFLVAACGGGGSSTPGDARSSNIPTLDSSATLLPAVLTSPYADVLADCVLAENDSSACTMEVLPLIGQDNEDPDIEFVMQRVVVSHEWMGIRFRQLLEAAPPELLTLMKSLTAVVIASDIRPSYYSSATAAMYLDPSYLWLTNAEKQTIDQAPDFRSGFDDELAFVSLSRYVRGNDYAWGFYPLDGNEVRNTDDTVLSTTRLLFHELAHANDFFPPHLISGLSRTDTVAEAADSLSSQRLSRQLNISYPLQSDLLFNLASIMYRGDTPTSADKLITAVDVGLGFEIDGANDDYAYSSIYEDTAMLFEEVMMKFHFDVSREVGYTDRPTQADPSCGDYIVRWGVRHRSGSPQIAPRAEQVLQFMLQQNDVGEYLAGLEDPVAMQLGKDWCSNLAEFSTRSTEAPAAPPPPVETYLRADDFGQRDLVRH